MRKTILLIPFLCILFLSVGSCTRAMISNGLVAFWRMDEAIGNTAFDSTNNHNDGAISGALWSLGYYNSCLSFDGSNDYVKVTHSNSLNFERTDKITFMFWVKITDISLEVSRDILSKIDTTDNCQRGYRIVQALGSSQIYFQLANQRVGGSPNYLAVITVNSIQIGEWHHLAIVYFGDSNADTIRMYVDGFKVDKSVTFNALSETIQNTHDFYLASFENMGNYYKGKLDETRIYNRALSDDEILQIFLGDERKATSPPMSYQDYLALNNITYLFVICIIAITLGFLALKIPISGLIGLIISFAVLLSNISLISSNAILLSFLVATIFINTICLMIGATKR